MTNKNRDFQVPLVLDAAHRRAVVGGEPMIFHCHHYNTFLQQSIQDASYVDSRPFLVGAANEVAYAQLTQLYREANVSDVAQRKAIAEHVFRWAGFGRFSLDGVSDKGGTVTTPHSHYSHAWKVKLGTSAVPVDFFTTGWLAGALAAIYDQPQGHFATRQLACMAAGAAQNEYELAATGDANYRVFESPGVGPLTEHQVRATPESPVDYEGIFAALSAMEIVGDETGAIPAFGVYLTRHYANYYNRISFEFVRDLSRQFGDEGVEVAQPLLTEAGHVCAFNTFGGIMTSTEWDGLIKPQLASREDWVHGIVAAVNALGWGRWQVTELDAKHGVFTVHDDYESVGHEALYGKASYPVAYLAQGAAMGIMDLVYVGNVEQKPEFTPAFYDRLFKSEHSYHCEVVECRGRGDAATSFRVYQQ